MLRVSRSQLFDAALLMLFDQLGPSPNLSMTTLKCPVWVDDINGAVMSDWSHSIGEWVSDALAHPRKLSSQKTDDNGLEAA